jgi:carbamoyltransferase
MNILGINAYHGDVAAALLRDGELVAAVEEERFRRVKHYAGFPRDAIRACLSIAGVEARDVEAFAVSRDPNAHLWRKGLFALRHGPSASLIRDRAANAMSVRHLARLCATELGLDESHVARRMHYVEHHAAHLASSYFASPFDDAAVCAIDGFGDFVSTSTGVGRGACLTIQNRVFFPHSLGLLYLALTQFLGFSKYGDEFKVMGLAPYGKPMFAEKIRQLVQVSDEGDLCLDLSYFTHWSGGMTMTWNDGEPEIGRVFTPKLELLLGPARPTDAPLDERHEAIAASLQSVYEEAAFKILRALHGRVRSPRLCLAGGCAMNSVANGKVRSETPFTELYVQPAAGDNGTALGAALHVWHRQGGGHRFEMRHGYWGPQFHEADIQAAVNARRGEVEERQCTRTDVSSEQQLCEWTASRIADGRVVGWFQGRMEWGARALGNRSILADPRRRDMRDIINARIKFRERFRPFAPSVAVEALHDYFVDAVHDPFMIQVFPVRPEKRDVIPAVTHVDGSGRLQSVSSETNPLYWALIQAFGRQTGVPVLLNTSFNENEPIVRTPDEALDCFLRTDMDVLVMGSLVLEKSAIGSGQPAGAGAVD